ncbi:hypothetical protein SAMN03159496_06399 [Rhizobium sp. NFR07]|uniref:hypothetical protein n=1 Tax=Rhizobium sp. NFR07 TaxID=1566262 RepID=UPI0008F3AEE7|nr:hypothetical protein [Rhizobium sp. NFR07]SFB64134.1 hypothetical protein SAMN03159496_06399 [Rhizobium sp. NFR07]
MWAYASAVFTYENLNFLIGFVGTALALWSLLKSRVARRFLYTRSDTTIIGATDEIYNERLEIRFEGHVIPRLTKTTMTFWNDAGKTLDHNDIAPADKLRLTLPIETQIISASLTDMSAPANNARIEISDDRNIFINFDYLDARQGFKLSCLHTGKRRAARVEGTIKGLGSPRDADYTSGLGAAWVMIKVLAFIGSTGGTGFAVAVGINYALDQYLHTFFKAVIGGICVIGAVILGFMILDRFGFLDGNRTRPRFKDDEPNLRAEIHEDLFEMPRP